MINMSAQKPRSIRCARNRERNDERRQQHEQQAQAINADKILGADRWNPGVTLDDLKTGQRRHRIFATALAHRIPTTALNISATARGLLCGPT